MDTEALKQRLLKAGCVEPELIGCSEEDIGKLRKAAQFPLPVDYIEMMRLLGRGAGEFMADVDIFFPGVLTIKDFFKEEIDACAGLFELPEDAFLFAQRRAEQFLYFQLKGENPSRIYRWSDSFKVTYKGPGKIVAESVWELLESELAVFEV